MRMALPSKGIDLYFPKATQLPIPHFFLLYTSLADLKTRTVKNGVKTKACSSNVSPSHHSCYFCWWADCSFDYYILSISFQIHQRVLAVTWAKKPAYKFRELCFQIFVQKPKKTQAAIAGSGANTYLSLAPSHRLHSKGSSFQ